MDRGCGVLLPIFSLPSKQGIGCFSKEAYKWVDDLKDAGQKYWQILPLGQTSFGNSPYQCISTYAGNPLFIDLEILEEEGYLTKAELEGMHPQKEEDLIDYEWLTAEKTKLLKLSFDRWKKQHVAEEEEAYRKFQEREAAWLEDFALFCALKEKFEDQAFTQWPDAYRLRDAQTLAKAREELSDQIAYVIYVQYLFAQQYEALKAYASERGIRMIGDLPIYVSGDSADAWTHPEIFQLDAEGLPQAVAGCPPDAYAPTGQLWGNPLYDWKKLEASGYRWWIDRMAYAFRQFDLVRIDHFRGFDAYYSIPAEDETAEHGHWEDGPGYGFFAAVEEALGKQDVIAEDLGFLTERVFELVDRTGYPGMKVLEFAFDPYGDSVYLPHHYTRNCVAYTGTHDNETLMGWYRNQHEDVRRFVDSYIGPCPEELKHLQMIRVLMMSAADTVIIPAQDYMGLDNDYRINIPSTIGGRNWRMRLPGFFSTEIKDVMRTFAHIYRRM